MITDEYTLARMIDAWEPPGAPHCSNCLHAKITGPPANPQVTCAKGQGRVTIPLLKLLRPRHALQIRPARECPDFDGMGPACEGRPRWK